MLADLTFNMLQVPLMINSGLIFTCLVQQLF